MADLAPPTGPWGLAGTAVMVVGAGGGGIGTSIARPLIAQRLVEIAHETGADAIAHGATGKGNDQVRFELSAYALDPQIRVIAPWREWDLLSREKLLAYARQHGIPVEYRRRKGGAPYSMDANLLHISYEGGVLEDPEYEPDESMWRITVSPEKAPRRPEHVELTYERGDIVAVNRRRMSPARVLAFAEVRRSAYAVVLHGDARLLDPPGPVDLVVTSPPYPGLIDYHEQHVYAFELLGLERRDADEIGRGLDGYCEGVARILARARAALAPGGRVVVVVNDRRGLYEGILAEAGLRLEERSARHVNRRTGRRSGEYFEDVLVAVPARRVRPRA